MHATPQRKSLPGSSGSAPQIIKRVTAQNLYPALLYTRFADLKKRPTFCFRSSFLYTGRGSTTSGGGTNSLNDSILMQPPCHYHTAGNPFLDHVILSFCSTLSVLLVLVPLHGAIVPTTRRPSSETKRKKLEQEPHFQSRHSPDKLRGGMNPPRSPVWY